MTTLQSEVSDATEDGDDNRDQQTLQATASNLEIVNIDILTCGFDHGATDDP